jgi:hypothetical protein
MRQSARSATWIDWFLAAWASFGLGGLTLALAASWLPGEITGAVVTTGALAILVLYRRARAARYPQISMMRLIRNPFSMPEDWDFWITAGTFGIAPATGVVVWWVLDHGQLGTGIICCAGYAAVLASYWYYRRADARFAESEAEMAAQESDMLRRLRRNLGEPD